jgi:hypothetical protein
MRKILAVAVIASLTAVPAFAKAQLQRFLSPVPARLR